MVKLTHRMHGDKIIFKVEIEKEDRDKDWCVIVSSKSNYGSGPESSRTHVISEYFYKVDKFCNIDSQEIEREYLMPGQYMASIKLGGMELPRSPKHNVLFEIIGYSLTDKDVEVAKELLSCMSKVYDKYATSKKGPFDNMMLDPMFNVIVDLFETVSERKMESFKSYIDFIYNRIELYGPVLKEGKYHWEEIMPGKIRKR